MFRIFSHILMFTNSSVQQANDILLTLRLICNCIVSHIKEHCQSQGYPDRTIIFFSSPGHQRVIEFIILCL